MDRLTAFPTTGCVYNLSNVWEAVYIQYLMGVHGVIVDRVEEISDAVAGFGLGKPGLGRGGAGVDGAKTHQAEAFSQQQLGFLLRLIPELIEQRHRQDGTPYVTSQFLTLEADGKNSSLGSTLVPTD